MKCRWLAAAGLLLSCAHQRHDDSAELHRLMYQMMSVISQLQPYMVSERRFNDKGNESQITAKLNDLAKLSKKVIHQKSLQVPSYRISGRVLDDHIQESYRVFRAGNKKYARFMLNSTPSACISCHTQGGESAKPLWILSQNDVKGTAFERAEFLFATRNYVEALSLYNDAIAKYPDDNDNVSVIDIETALIRKLSYYVRVQHNDVTALASLRDDLKNHKLPQPLRQAMQSWVAILQERLKKPETDFTAEAVLKRARSVLGGPRLEVGAESPKLIEYLVVSGELAQTLQAQPKGESTPELLYWSGFAELSLNRQFSFSLGPLYLRECVVDYPASPIASRCLGELENEWRALYTGSRGTQVPPDVQDEAEQLRALIKVPTSNSASH